MTKEDELGDPFFRHSEATFILRSLFLPFPIIPNMKLKSRACSVEQQLLIDVLMLCPLWR